MIRFVTSKNFICTFVFRSCFICIIPSSLYSNHLRCEKSLIVIQSSGGSKYLARQQASKQPRHRHRIQQHLALPTYLAQRPPSSKPAPPLTSQIPAFIPTIYHLHSTIPSSPVPTQSKPNQSHPPESPSRPIYLSRFLLSSILSPSLFDPSPPSPAQPSPALTILPHHHSQPPPSSPLSTRPSAPFSHPAPGVLD